MALFRNSTFAGSMKIEVSGRMLLVTRKSTACPNLSMIHISGGARTNIPRTAMMAPHMPAEKLSTSISNPGLILPVHRPSMRFIT